MKRREGVVAMRVLLIAALSLVSTAAAAEKVQPVPPASPDASKSPGVCPQSTVQFAARPGERAKLRNLTDLPDANMYVAVYRHVGRCEVPIVVEYGIGSR
jgi:hypothetical protein